MSLTWLRCFLSFFDRRFIALFITECAGEPFCGQNLHSYLGRSRPRSSCFRALAEPGMSPDSA